MKKSLLPILTLAIVGAAGTAFYQSRIVVRERAALLDRQKRVAALERELADVRRERSDALRDLQFAEQNARAARTKPPTAAPADSAQAAQIKSWLSRVKRLRQSFDEHRDQWIPELKLLSDLDWMELVRDLPLETELDLRQARALARSTVVRKFTQSMREALREYLAATNGMLPAAVTDLAPYFKPPADPAMLARYEMRAAGNSRELRGAEAIAERAPIDEEFDLRHSVNASGGGGSQPWALSFLRLALEQAQKDFRAANGERRPSGEADMMPYVRDPVAKAIFQARIDYLKAHDGREPPNSEVIRPYVKDPAALAQLEKIIRAQSVAQRSR